MSCKNVLDDVVKSKSSLLFNIPVVGGRYIFLKLFYSAKHFRFRFPLLRGNLITRKQIHFHLVLYTYVCMSEGIYLCL